MTSNQLTTQSTFNGSINTTGIITAGQFVGDGSGLTGVTATGSGYTETTSGSEKIWTFTTTPGGNITFSK